MAKVFSALDQSIIRNLMLTVSFKDIAAFMKCEVEDVAALIESMVAGTNIITCQAKLDFTREYKKSQRLQNAAPKSLGRPSKAKPKKKERVTDPVLDRKREEREKQQRIMDQLQERRMAKKEREQPKFPGRKVDYSKKQLVNVGNKISIYVDPSKSIRQQVEDFKNSPGYKKYFDKE